MRLVVVLLGVLALAWPATRAEAKDVIPERGYAVITGPGLSHPLVFAAPWKKEFGGYYSGEAERFLAFAEGSGAIPAGRLETEAGDYVPYGVLPIHEVPSKDSRGPRYRLTWFRDGIKEVAKQNLYPYAPAGPLVYTFPASRSALILLFGRFQAPAHLWTGWGRATSFDLLTFLRAYGLPEVEPSTRSGPEVAPDTVSAASAPPSTGVLFLPYSRPMLPISLAAGGLLLLIAMTTLWMRRRS